VTLFQELAERDKCTIVMVTHDNRILDVADRIVNMVDGRIKSDVYVQESSAICEFLSGCPVFSHLTPGTLTDVADQMVLERHPAGAIVIRQGDPGELFYLIRSGIVDVLVDDGAEQRVVAQLAEGDYFGEAALLEDKPRNATIRAREPLEVYTLGKSEFHRVLQSSATFAEELRKALFERQ
jgi:putative ABC transport system ATP-binding protein